MTAVRLPDAATPYVLIERTNERDVLEVDPATIIDLYRTHGAILLRGFCADAVHFRDFARQFCATAVVNESRGRQPIDAAHHIHAVDAGTRAFALHPELAREPWKPDVAMFGCLSAPSVGGRTTICDGVALNRALPEVVRSGLAGRRLVYVMPTWPALLEYWLGSGEPDDALLSSPPQSCPYRFERRGDRVVRYFSRPALHRPMFIDAPAFGNFLLFARFNNNRTDFPLLDDGTSVPEVWLQSIKSAGDRIATEISWQSGDVLMLDNTRFMHGRTAIVDGGTRLVATFFGYLKFACPNPEEPVDAIWRREDFRPPLPPDLVR